MGREPIVYFGLGESSQVSVALDMFDHCPRPVWVLGQDCPNFAEQVRCGNHQKPAVAHFPAELPSRFGDFGGKTLFLLLSISRAVIIGRVSWPFGSGPL
jgi:hypothetical protein